MNSSVLTMIVAPRGTSPRLAISAAGFIATSTSGASPGVSTSWSAKCSWKLLTPGRVPWGARISAGKLGSVDRSLPIAAVSLVKRSPVSCIPSPESPAKRITTRSSVWTDLLLTVHPGSVGERSVVLCLPSCRGRSVFHRTSRGRCLHGCPRGRCAGRRSSRGGLAGSRDRGEGRRRRGEVGVVVRAGRRAQVAAAVVVRSGGAVRVVRAVVVHRSRPPGTSSTGRARPPRLDIVPSYDFCMENVRVVDGGGPSGPPSTGAPPGVSGPEVVARVAAWREWLASVDTSGWSDRDRVDLVAELERCKGAASAGQARATDAVRRSREASAPQDAVRSVGSEVALARRESPALGDRFVGLARALVHEMPSTLRALSDGVAGERHAVAVVQATSTLSLDDRVEVDRRIGPLLGRLGVGAVARAAQKVAAELDAASVVRRMEEAARSRRVTVRPAADGMAYLTVLAPLRETVGAYAALRARATAVVGGQCPDEAAEGRGVGAVMADTATRLMSGRGRARRNRWRCTS